MIALRKVQGIRRRLGGSGNIADPFPAKPKGMRSATYERLHDEYLDAFEEHLSEMAAHYGRIDKVTSKALKSLGLGK